jgi:hypothetical protein
MFQKLGLFPSSSELTSITGSVHVSITTAIQIPKGVNKKLCNKNTIKYAQT